MNFLKTRSYSLLCVIASLIILSGCKSNELSVEGINGVLRSKKIAENSLRIFAKQATRDSLFEVAEVLEMAAESELIQIKRVEDELMSIGGELIEVEIQKAPSDNTISNLYGAKANAEYEVMSLLPEAIDAAKREKFSSTSTLLEEIMEIEECLAERFISLIELLQSSKQDSLFEDSLEVCPKCGMIISSGSNCNICK